MKWVTGNASLPPLPPGSYELDQQLVFLVSLTTHGGDLSKYHVLDQARLSLSDGVWLAPAGWLPLSRDSHHPSGLLLFQGTGLVEKARTADRVDLVLQDLGRVPSRTYRWPKMPGETP